MLYETQSIKKSVDNSILEVMKAIDESASKFAMIMDEKDHLMGLVTDGDIRRGFLEGHDPGEPIKNIMNKNPVVARESISREAMLELLSDKFAQIPVVDHEGKVKGVITYRDKSVVLDAKERKVCIVGLGYAGLTLAVVLADVGFTVLGYDINEALVEEINKGQCPFHEEGLGGYLRRHTGKKLQCFSEFSSCNADTYIITVGTPVDAETKIPRMEYIEKAAKEVAAKLKPDNLVILRSTVPVGTTRQVVTPILNKISGLEAGMGYYVAYAPERTVEGNATRELRELPQIIGGYDEKSTILAERLFREVTSTIVDVGSLEGAEMVKILNNTFRDVKFAFANEMALICRELGLDMVKLVQAANHGYIRDKIPVPSPGVGGACLTKDPYILMYSCNEIRFKPRIVEVARKTNEFIPYEIVEEIHEEIKKLKKDMLSVKVFIIGCAFKGEPETSDTRGSTTIDLLNCFRQKGYRDQSFFGYDAVVSKEEINNLGMTPVSLIKGFEDADVVVIMNNHKSHKKMDIFELLRTSQEDCIFMDGWYTFEPRDMKMIGKIKYLGIGCKA